ncbi:ABC transporter ATP-binding protein [Humidisolicoccus flavus]|uniref:ABC transporter ATP-binding protein n=1 Tax=Humidisolicoccus flavus TaxID=3111414 RepID=UPI0032449EF9
MLKRKQTKDAGPRASFRQLLPYLFERRGLLVLTLILSVLGAITALLQPVLVQQVIVRVEAAEPLTIIVYALIALVVANGLATGFQHYLLQRMGEGVVLSSRKQLVAKILHLPIAEFDARRTGDLVSRVGSDTTLLRAVLTQGLVEAIGGTLTFVGAIVAMLIIDPILFLLTLAVVVIALALVVVLSGKIRKASLVAQERVGALTSSIERAISSVRTVRAANATEREITTVHENSTAAYGAGLKVARISALVVPIAGIAMNAAFITVLGVGGFRVASGDLPIASLVSFLLFLFLMIMPLGQAIGAIMAVNQALGALGRIQEIINLPSESHNDAPRQDTVVATAGVPAIEFSGVSFRYPDAVVRAKSEESPHETVQQKPILQEISFTVERGSRTALVGPSGAGKSTIFALIERFYDASSGTVRIHGTDIADVSRAGLRAGIGYVEQDASVLAGTIRENLVLGAPDASDEDCLRVLDEVNLAALVTRNELGLSAQVGEGGVMLSGGERQRLAIARALLAGPPLLLLDESTSSLDGTNEQLLGDAIRRASEDRTLLVIAHRLSTVIDSDRIIVIDGGEIKGVGTHEELIQTVPLYRALAATQLLVPEDEAAAGV